MLPRFRPTGQGDLAPSGQGERARANLAALETLRTLQGEQRAATAAEQQALARWSGWGALPLIFEGRPVREVADSDAAHERATARWEALDAVRTRVSELLTEAEWAAARRNTLNAHYTDAALVDVMWGALQELGFDGGQVLEPGSGSGNFIGFSPTDIPVQMTGVEVEPTTAALSRLLYPDAEVVTSGFEDLTLPDGAYDAVVGNVPFGNYKRFDPVHNPDLKLSIHDHFILKALAATRPGGMVALVTSRYTLDKEDPEARERMHQLGDLVGAVRLPASAHKAAAGTDVVTDVLFLRRRRPDEEPDEAGWLTAPRRVLPGEDTPVAVNTYFTDHPEHVLGELRTRIGPFGPELTVRGSVAEMPDAFAAAATDIANTAHEAGLAFEPEQGLAGERARQAWAQGATEGSLGLDEAGQPTIVEDGRIVPLDIHPEQRDKLIQLIGLKEQTQALYAAEAATDAPGETPQLAAQRAELRLAYRTYRTKNPPPAKPRQPFKFTPQQAKDRAAAEQLASVPEEWKAKTAYAFIDDDPDASLLFGLEEWDEATSTATEQQVLSTRVLEPRQLPTVADSPEDAIALAMEHDGGRLDMARIGALLGVDEAEASAQLGHAGLAFRDPEQDGAWEPRHRYLSGNVRTKLQQARTAAAQDPSLAANVAALEQVQPVPLTPSEIKAKLGAPWVPADVYTGFLQHLGFADAEVKHAGGTVWEVTGARFGDLARSEWGTPERSTQDLYLALLRQTDSMISVTYQDSDGHVFTDQEATDAAREKARLLAEAFEDWVWADDTRAAQLADRYNEQFNNQVLAEYSTTPLTLPGAVTDWEMRPHQNAAIRRIVNEPTALLAHVVGAGKTATMAAGAMELRRTGLAKKPVVVVPNHMLKQWGREFRELYPNASLLAISASDLSQKKRAKFMARIAGGSWDAVILTHEAFNRLPLRPETQQAYMDREMANLRAQADAAQAIGMDDRTIKQIENTLANAEAHLKKQIAQTSARGVFLEDTGIDYLFLDESHEYKNLRTVSAIPGAAIEGSAKATKLHMVLDYLRENTDSDRVATLATGTPIANSVTEAYVLMRYLAPQLLDDMGLDAFDNWAATFGEVVSALEPDPKGNGYRYKARFSRFFNVPELMVGYRSFADVRLAEDLDLPTPPVRKDADGQRGETILIPPTAAQRDFIKALPHQPWVNKPGGVLKALGEGLRASLDMRLVGGNEEQGSKLSYAAEKIAEIWQQTKDTVYPVSEEDPTPQPLPGGLQLVFLDEGTPGSKAKNGEDLYADLREQLAERGIPREQVRFIHEANTDRKKEKLFADARAGRVAVLVGSTQKMGTGTNVQSRAVALHHLSYPWRPADMAQRDGRIERQGNLNYPTVPDTPDDVRVLYYVTERTFDEFRLNTLARKARFISQIQRSDLTVREIEEIGAEALNLGMLSALASGDPAILQQAEATAERVRLQGLSRSWDRQQDARIQQIREVDNFLTRAEQSLTRMRAATPTPTTGDAFAMTVDGATFRTREDAANALGERMVALARDASLTSREAIPVGQLGGIAFHAETAYDFSGRRLLRLRFPWGHVVPDGQREDRAQWQAANVTRENGRGAIQSLERWLNRLDDDITKLDTAVTAQRTSRDETSQNLQPKSANPYREQARSKDREERLLGQLVIVNEKEFLLAERVENADEYATDEMRAELDTLREEVTRLRQQIADEHTLQEAARAGHLPQASEAADTSTPRAQTDPGIGQETAPPGQRDETGTQTTLEGPGLSTAAAGARPEEAPGTDKTTDLVAPAPSRPPADLGPKTTGPAAAATPVAPVAPVADNTPASSSTDTAQDPSPAATDVDIATTAAPADSDVPAQPEAPESSSAADESAPSSTPDLETDLSADGPPAVTGAEAQGRQGDPDDDGGQSSLPADTDTTATEATDPARRADDGQLGLFGDLSAELPEAEPQTSPPAAEPGDADARPPETPEPDAPSPTAPTGTPDRTEGTPVATPIADAEQPQPAPSAPNASGGPAESGPAAPAPDPRADAPTETPLTADGRYTLLLHPAPMGQAPRTGEVRYTIDDTSITVATLSSDADGGWWATIGNNDTPVEQNPLAAADVALMVWSVETGEAIDEPPAPFRAQESATRSTQIASALETHLERHYPELQHTAERLWEEEYSRIPELMAITEAVSDLRHAATAGAITRPSGALRAADDLARLRDAATGWRSELSGEAREHLGFRLARLAYDSGQLQTQIRLTVDEVRAEQAPAPAAAVQSETEQLSTTADRPTRETAEQSQSDPLDPTGLSPFDLAPQETAPEPVIPTATRAANTAAAREAAPEPESAAPAAPEPDLAARAEAPEMRPLPLWTGNDLPDGKWSQRDGVLYDTYGAPQWKLKKTPQGSEPGEDQAAPAAAVPRAAENGSAYEPVDLWEAWGPVEEAWEDIVPPDMGTAEDLRAAVFDHVDMLQRQYHQRDPSARDAAAEPAAAPAADPGARPNASAAAEAVNGALQQADTHAAALRDLPEWQELRTVRGATANLWNVLREKAGAYATEFMADVRVQGFWRTVSTRTADNIAHWAQAGADRLRRGSRGGDLPSAEALLKLSDTALTYSTPLRPTPPQDLEQAAAHDRGATEIGGLSRTLRDGTPLPYATRDEAVAASQGINEAFVAWRSTPMGKELDASDHPRVEALRDAWRQLPEASLPDGPGPAAGRYGEVADFAHGLVDRAQQQSGRFSEADLAALRKVADLAEHHGGRLAATLPPGVAGPSAPGPAVQQAVAPRPAVAAPVAPPKTGAGISA